MAPHEAQPYLREPGSMEIDWFEGAAKAGEMVLIDVGARSSFTKAASASTALFLSGLLVFSHAAFAQSPPPPHPPDMMMLSPAGVDLRSGLYQVNKTLLSAGDPAVGGIDFRRVPRTYGPHGRLGRMSQFNHNWDIEFRERIVGINAYVDVTSDTLSFTFPQPLTGSSYGSLSGIHARLTKTAQGGGGHYYTLQVSGGPTVVSRAVGSNGRALAASVTLPNQAKYSMTYDNLGPSGAARLRSVVSSLGYGLVLEYHPNSGTNYFLSKACVVNLTQTQLPSTCPSSAPKVTYGYNGSILTSETDATGAVWNFTSTYSGAPNSFQEAYFNPGESSPYVTLVYSWAFDAEQPVVVTQNFADGRQFGYSWFSAEVDPVDSGVTTSGYGQTGVGSTAVTIGAYRPDVYTPLQYTPGPESVQDPLGRTTTFQYCPTTPCAGPYKLHSKTHPDGQKETFEYDGARNVTKRTQIAKPGSGLPSLVTQASYNCASMLLCNKPTWIIDPNGHTTDFTYDAAHGGILTETGPGVNGIRPQKRYAYTQRYAWISNGSGGYVQAASPVWLLISESFCRTSAATGNPSAPCATAGDEVLTTYDYGPNGGPNNLRLRGTTVNAEGVTRRTCYAYDSLGRKISETSPNANLTSCP